MSTRLMLYSEPILVTLAKIRLLDEEREESWAPETFSRILSHIPEGSVGVEVSVIPEMSQPGPADWRVVDLKQEAKFIRSKKI